jgi:hypothetical protein
MGHTVNRQMRLSLPNEIEPGWVRCWRYLEYAPLSWHRQQTGRGERQRHGLGARLQAKPRGSNTIPGPKHQAARTVSRNLPTSSLRRLLSRKSDCAAGTTYDEAEPVSQAPRWASVMLEETCE